MSPFCTLRGGSVAHDSAEGGTPSRVLEQRVGAIAAAAAPRSRSSVKLEQSPQPRSCAPWRRCRPEWPQLGEAHLVWLTGAYMKAAFSVYQQSPRSDARSCKNPAKKVEPVLCGARSTIAGGRARRVASAPQGTRRGSDFRVASLSLTVAGEARLCAGRACAPASGSGGRSRGVLGLSCSVVVGATKRVARER